MLALHKAAKISADRIGFLVSEVKEEALKALMKLASGLKEDYLRFNFAAYLEQEKELRTQRGSEFEFLSTHPMFTARIRALLWFEMSQPYYNWLGIKEKAPFTKDEIDKKIDLDLMAVSGYRLFHMNQNLMNSTLFWGVIALFSMDHKLSKEEQLFLKNIFGEEKTRKAINFIKEFGQTEVIDKLEGYLKGASDLSKPHKGELYKDLKKWASLASGGNRQINSLLTDVGKKLNLA